MTPHWLDISEYPFKSNFFFINDVKLHYIDEGTGHILLFVHGTPSWSFDFRKLIKVLSKSYRCIAIDHIGFGLSDKPENYDYSTQNHSKTLENFIEEKKLKSFTMVVHDFGGPIALNVAIHHPQKLKSLIIFNSWMWNCSAEAEYIKLRRMLRSPLLPFLYRYFNFSAKVLLPKSFGKKKINSALLKQYTQPFSKSKHRNGTIAFAKSLLNDQEWFGTLWDKKEAISGKPALFIWGLNDPFITFKYLEKFQSGFSNSCVLHLKDCGHFPQEEEAEQVITEIENFLLTS